MRLALLGSAMPLLSGCVAAVAVAVPALTGAGIVSERKRAEDRQDQDRAEATVTSGSTTPVPINPADRSGLAARIANGELVPSRGTGDAASTPELLTALPEPGERPEVDSTAPSPQQPGSQQPSGQQSGSSDLAGRIARGELVPSGGSGTLPGGIALLPALPEPGADPLPGAPASAGYGWDDFVSFALRRVAARKAGEPVPSVILPSEAASRLEITQPPCKAQESGVVIDLDPAGGPLSTSADTVPAPGLAVALARLRNAGVVVLWVSSLHGNDITKVGDLLHRSGLDPDARDPILLAKNADERKQVMRTQADEDVCVLAMAGDDRADFDELFEFLRNPAEETPLDLMIGNGWFLTPSPLGRGPQ